MPSPHINVCVITPTAGGTTDWTVSAATLGYQLLSAAGAQNGMYYSYRAESSDLSQWEVGLGMYTAGAPDVLSRLIVIANSAGSTAKINFSTVPKVAVVALAENLAAVPITPRMFGAKGVGDEKTIVQLAIDKIAALGGGRLWFDQVYTVGGAKHANGFSLLDWKNGVALVGPGGLKMADNTNVVAAVFTATFSGTTMTISTFTSGSITAGHFLCPQVLPSALGVATKIVSLASGTPNTPGAIYNVTSTNTIASPISLKSCDRFAELIGNYDMTTGLVRGECSISLDMNGQNNCASQTIWTFNAVVSILKGSDNDFRFAKFLNNAGSNTIVAGIAAGNVVNTTVVACLFESEGDRINTASLDYSSIFSFSDGIKVTDCTFRLGAATNGCPWEVYVGDILVAGNFVQGYFNTANICAVTSMTTAGVNFSDNVIRDCSVGFTLWNTATSSKLIGLKIADNVLHYLVSAAGGPYFVNGTSQVIFNSVIRNISITGNVAENVDISDTSRSADCISLACAAGVKISGNQLYGFAGRGVYCVHQLGGSYEITNNQLSWIGYGGTVGSNQRTGIWLENSDLGGTMDTVLVEGNEITTQGSYTLTYGIWSALNTTEGYVGGNPTVGATTKMVWTGTGMSGVAYTLPKSSGFVDVATFQPSTYIKSREGTVHVEGVLDTGTISGTTTFATLPAGYRPTGTLLVGGYNLTTDLMQALIINSTGTITNRAGIATGARVSFSADFKAAS